MENFEANRIAKTITKFAITTKLNMIQKTRAISSYKKEALKNAETMKQKTAGTAKI